MPFKGAIIIVLALSLNLFCNFKAWAGEITVSAAASLTNAFGAIKTAFEQKNSDVKVFLNFAASNPLLKQMQEGAPVDVFASADQETMDKAAASKCIDPKSRQDFVRNTLVLITPKGATNVKSLADLPKINKIAIGNPDSVPAGRYAKEVLQNEKLWEELGPKFIYGNNVRQVLDYVSRGEVDAGIVYGTDAQHQKEKVAIVSTLTGHKPVLYPIALATTGKNSKDGQKFINFVLSSQGMNILAQFGFAKP
ncbi:MAG: molybdate ABC transporter substrate-binding protein [Desulfovibrionaceae bacterium]|nr:molybdate ABC transporter substrate-binding protein [Desulfovibrionaceae bacterium]